MQRGEAHQHAGSKESEESVPTSTPYDPVSLSLQMRVTLDEFWCSGNLYINVILVEYISALQMIHSKNETVEGAWDCIYLFCSSSGKNLNSRCTSKVLEPRRALQNTQEMSFSHGLPGLAGDGRQPSRPLNSSLVHNLWLSLLGTLNDMFDKHILLICVPRALVSG